VHSVHLEVHAQVIHGVLTVRVPVELRSIEVLDSSRECFSETRREALDYRVDGPLVRSFILRTGDGRRSHILLSFSEFIVIGCIVCCIGAEVNRRLARIPALIDTDTIFFYSL